MGKKRLNIPVYTYFIAGAILVILLFPGLSDKNDRKVNIPELQIEEVVAEFQVARFETSVNVAGLQGAEWKIPAVSNSLREIYHKGVISVSDCNTLKQNGAENVIIIRSGERETQPMANIYTPKTAYSHIKRQLLEESSVDFTPQEIQSLDINRFLDANITCLPIPENMSGIPYAYAGGLAIIICGLFACFYFYFRLLRERIHESRKDVFFTLLMAVMFIVVTEIFHTSRLFNIYIIPYAIIPIVVRTFFDSRTAQITHLFAVMICSLMTTVPFDFLLMQITVCMVSIYVLKNLTNRSELIKCSFYILGTYIITYTALQLFHNGGFSAIDYKIPLYFAVNFIFVTFAYPFIYIIEKLFGYISNVTLVELSDINSPALRELSETCPGTFHHSLQVSTLAAAAAPKIKANPQLVRTGALYHDIGKISNPQYFVENRTGAVNPHDSLTLEQSAQIITSHVPEGEKIAARYKIPAEIVRFIRTHHGHGKAKYFYNTYKNQHPDQPVNEAIFSYQGENPDTRETALLMIADSVEAAARSLTDYSEESLKSLIDRIIDSQIADGLLESAPLTFKNIRDIKHVFLERLISIHHVRIKYPEEQK
ncbi:MAG: HDIG domain-containing protein [Dysgonamonadaceae bacterium]|jgi:putative nucleotidyltransferase with HDIG domain|nr:HDIG domain-containing protein [Dysgonamonadaceae bacterium]